MSALGPAENEASAQAAAIIADLPERPNLLLVLSGPSGSGKDAIRNQLKTWGLAAHFAVTAATRSPRAGEVEGVDYLFVTEAAFDRMERDGELLEHALVYGQRRGVPRSQVLEPLSMGQDVVVRVDVQGAATLKNLVPEALLLFVAPPSLEEEARRLQSRGTEADADLSLRGEMAKSEMEAAIHFDHIVVNETGALEMASLQVLTLLAERKRWAASA